jgi:hypothetical protein
MPAPIGDAPAPTGAFPFLCGGTGALEKGGIQVAESVKRASPIQVARKWPGRRYYLAPGRSRFFVQKTRYIGARQSANLKGIGEGIKKNAEETAANAAKGVVKGTVEGVKESIKESLSRKKREREKIDMPSESAAIDK